MRFCECGERLSQEARADVEFCSNACRQRAYRRRRSALKRYGSWENAIAEITAAMEACATGGQAESRNA
jgi:hypothetical protein